MYAKKSTLELLINSTI